MKLNTYMRRSGISNTAAWRVSFRTRLLGVEELEALCEEILVDWTPGYNVQAARLDIVNIGDAEWSGQYLSASQDVARRLGLPPGLYPVLAIRRLYPQCSTLPEGYNYARMYTTGGNPHSQIGITDYYLVARVITGDDTL